MRRCLFIALTIIGICGSAEAVTVLPSLEFAAREYGFSGMYSSMSDSSDNSTSDFLINARWGIITTFGVELEAEAGYGRNRQKTILGTVDAPITNQLTTQSFTIGGNALYNWNVFSQTTVFGLVGYRYARDWSDTEQKDEDGDVIEPADDDEETSTKMSYRIFQYGFGVKYYFVPNAGIRVEYRRESASGLPEDVDVERYKQTRILIGISIYQ